MADRRLFFALWPDERQRETLRDALSPALATVEGRPVDRHNWHVTLVFIGDFPEEQIPFLQAAAGELPLEPIRLRFDRLAYWPRAKVAALLPLNTPEPLQRLASSLEESLRAFDFEPEERLFRPHITVARRVRQFDAIPLARPVDLEWEGFALLESAPVQGGVRYRPINQ